VPAGRNVDRNLRRGRHANQTIRPLGITSLVRRLRSISLCDALGPLRVFVSPYFFVGMNGTAAAVRTGQNRGVDLVWDLRNMQFATFFYTGQGYRTLVGLEASVYMGYGFGRKDNVIDAWSGQFETADASVDVPLLHISAGGPVFASPDRSIWGGAISAGVGLNVLEPIGGVSMGVTDATWTGWDEATRAFGRSYFLVSYSERSAHAKGCTSIQPEA
jgi:hypothetical protein